MKKIIFMGDSITCDERNFNSAIGTEEQLGRGYVKLVHAGLFANNYKEKYQFINHGVNGDRIIDLKGRFDKDVLQHKPDVVFTMIGVNDAWRHFDTPFQFIDQISVDGFREKYSKMIKEMLNNNITPVIVSAFFLDLNKSDQMRQLVDDYNIAAKEVSEEYDVMYVDIQKVMDTFLKHQSSYVLSRDRVHVNYIGTQIIANEVMKAIKSL